MRVDESSILRHRSDAVRVAIRRQSGMTLFFENYFSQRIDMRLDRFRIDPRKQRIHLLPDRHV